MSPSVLLAILTHHDLPRLERAIRSALRQLRANIDVKTQVVVNSQDDVHATAAVALCRQLDVPCVVTDSNGRPGRGKNACIDAFLASDCDYLCQLDGDNWLYPTWAQAVADHLNRAPALDGVGLLPVDCVGRTDGYSWTLPDGLAASVWTTSTVYPWPTVGPGIDNLWTEYPINPAIIALISRQVAARWRFHEDLAVNEDYLMLLTYLAAHIHGDIEFWISMSSDWLVVDLLTPNSVTDVHFHDHDHFRRLARQVIDPARSSVVELPIIYPPMLQSGADKRQWIDELHISPHPLAVS